VRMSIQLRRARTALAELAAFAPNWLATDYADSRCAATDRATVPGRSMLS
jgi:hypothetical protein